MLLPSTVIILVSSVTVIVFTTLSSFGTGSYTKVVPGTSGQKGLSMTRGSVKLAEPKSASSQGPACPAPVKKLRSIITPNVKRPIKANVLMVYLLTFLFLNHNINQEGFLRISKWINWVLRTSPYYSLS